MDLQTACRRRSRVNDRYRQDGIIACAEVEGQVRCADRLRGEIAFLNRDCRARYGVVCAGYEGGRAVLDAAERVAVECHRDCDVGLVRRLLVEGRVCWCDRRVARCRCRVHDRYCHHGIGARAEVEG